MAVISVLKQITVISIVPLKVELFHDCEIIV